MVCVEFPSVVEDVACAVAVQRGMSERNAATSERVDDIQWVTE
jgi:hypothetical protein